MQKKFIIILLLYFIMLSGCATGLKAVGQGEKIALSENEAFVFGKIVIIENGKEITPYTLFREPSPTVFNLEADKKSMLRLESDGSFYWILPKGTYLISAIHVSDLGIGYRFPPQVAFQIVSGGEVFYIGTLIIDAEVRRTIIGEYKLKNVKAIFVVDESKEAEKALTRHNPDYTPEIKMNFMIHDEKLPADFSLQTKMELLRLLGAIFIGPK